MSMKISLIDYDIGNVRSISNSFLANGAEVVLTRNKEDLLTSDAVILPGVGAFSVGYNKLKELDLISTIEKICDKQVPFLGICLGMQLLFTEGEEFGVSPGLGIIDGRVSKLELDNSKFKLPHIGWNGITSPEEMNWNGTIFDGIKPNADMYFVHTFAATPKDPKNVLSKTEYGGNSFCSSVKKGNVYGCQFHPEKSGEFGLKIISNFIKIAKKEL